MRTVEIIEIPENIKETPIIKNLGIKKQILLIERYNKLANNISQKVVMNKEKEEEWEKFKGEVQLLYIKLSITFIVIKRVLVKEVKVNEEIQLTYIKEVSKDMDKTFIEKADRDEEWIDNLEKEFEKFI